MDTPEVAGAEGFLAFYAPHRQSVLDALMHAGLCARDAELRVGEVFRQLQEAGAPGLSDDAAPEHIRSIARELAATGQIESP